MSDPGSTTATGASTTGGGGGNAATSGMGGAGGASNASSSGDSSSSAASSGGTGGAGGGPVDLCGNGIIDPDEECDDMGSGDDTFCTNCQWTCLIGKENPANHHCYAHSGINGALNWAGAKAACASAGGYLATLTSSAERMWILQNVPPPTDSFLGGSDMTTEGTFAWITGEPWTWGQSGAPWDMGEPNGSGDCLQLKEGDMDTGDFDDINCDIEQPFYCERDPPGKPKP